MKQVLKIAGFGLRAGIYFIYFVLAYLSVAYVLSNITTKAEVQTGEKLITAYIKSNNVHTDIVFPVVQGDTDWSKTFPYENTRSGNKNMKYIAIGWGDKGFYLNTPTWGDLTFKTAFKAVFGLSSTALHVSYYADIKADGKTCIALKMNQKQYQNVKNYVLKSLKRNPKLKPVFIPTKAVYGDHDAFYNAKGRYSLFSTCNSWTNEALKQAGQKAVIWTPFESGVFKAYR